MRNDKLLLLLLIPFCFGCDAIAIPPVDDTVQPENTYGSEIIPCLCDQENTTTDWVYCDPVIVNVQKATMISAEMIYSIELENSSGVIAELFDFVAEEAIPASRVESSSSSRIQNLYSGNMANSLKDGGKEVVIRFRNTEENAVAYIPNTSRLVLTYEY